MFLFNLLGVQIFSTSNLGDYQYLATIVNFMNEAIIPISVTLVIATALFSIVLAFMIMKAESAEKADEMKKRLFHLMITVVCIVIAIWLLTWLLSNFGTIMNAIRGMGSGIG